MEKNYHLILKSRPGVNGEPTKDNFEYTECSYPEVLQDQDVLVKMVYLSIDPALRCCMNPNTGVDYIKSWELGETVMGMSGIGQVMDSKNPKFIKLSLVLVNMRCPWMKFVNFKQGEYLVPIDKMSQEYLLASSPSLAVSVLGITGLTAYIGVTERGHVTPGANQVMVVSGAAGATGSIAGQVARLLGCSQVVGICGTDTKCKLLTEELKFNACINYKTEDVASRLRELCPDGVDIYFDNVGGDLSSEIIKQMKVNSHVILCGQIAVYNKDLPYPPPIDEHITQIIQDKNITRERFLVLNYMNEFEKAKLQLLQWLQEGKIINKETIAEGLENAGDAFVSMMKGGNIGKQLVHIADPVTV